MCPGGWGVPGIPGLLPPLITNGVPGYAKTGLWGIPPPDGKKKTVTLTHYLTKISNR